MFSRQRVKTLVVVAFVAFLVFAGFIELAFFAPATAAKPAFMERYNHDPFAKANLHGKCTVCHVGHGGGERNDFGEAFEDAGFRITPKLREKFPDLFIPAAASTDRSDRQSTKKTLR